MPLYNLRKIHLYLSIALLLAACTGKSKKDLLLEELTADLQYSNRDINSQASYTLHLLNNKTTEPSTADRASFWLPKAERIAFITSEYTSYLTTLKANTDNNDDSLKTKTDNYIRELQSIDEEITDIFLKKLTELKDFVSIKKSLKETNNNAFVETLINKAKRLELKTITFCNEKVGIIDGDMFSVFEGIVGQNSTIFQQGEKLKIFAGVGSYSRAAKPAIKIMQMSVDISEEGYASFEMKVPDKPGKYKVPVEIKYFDHYIGKEESRIITIEYTVAAPCN
jgi:hypothetical protein